MGNRHGHKKLRVAVRTRMATSGESYQKALAQVLRLRDSAGRTPALSDVAGGGVDLLSIRYFGIPAGLATFEIAGRLAVLVVSSPCHSAPLPNNPIIALGWQRTVH